MATKTKKTTSRKTSKSPARKAAARKTTGKRTTARPSRPAGPREDKLASGALRLVDEAAALLRKGIRTGAETSEKTRTDTRKKAHNLLTRASSSLGQLLSEGTSTLHKVINKL